MVTMADWKAKQQEQKYQLPQRAPSEKALGGGAGIVFSSTSPEPAWEMGAA